METLAILKMCITVQEWTRMAEFLTSFKEANQNDRNLTLL